MASEYYRVADLQTRLESLTHSVGLVVAAFVFGSLLSTVTVSLHPGLVVTAQSVEATTPLAYAVYTASQFVGFFAVIAVYLGWRSDLQLFEVGPPSARDAAWIMGGFVALYLVALALTSLFQVIGVETATNRVITDGRQDPVRFLYLVPVTFFFVAPAEELLFRGIVQGLFRRAYGVAPAVVLASVLFGAPHYLALVGSGNTRLPAVVLITALGILLGLLYERTENLLVPVAVHAMWNSMSFLGQYVGSASI